MVPAKFLASLAPCCRVAEEVWTSMQLTLRYYTCSATQDHITAAHQKGRTWAVIWLAEFWRAYQRWLSRFRGGLVQDTWCATAWHKDPEPSQRQQQTHASRVRRPRPCIYLPCIWKPTRRNGAALLSFAGPMLRVHILRSALDHAKHCCAACSPRLSPSS